MTASEKKQFMMDLTANVLAECINNVDKMPEEWDGHELRLYIADKFDDSVSSGLMTRGSKRRREYLNTVIVSNL